MRTALLALLLCCLPAQGRTLLEAIAMVESGPNDYAVGRAGEVSRYQLLPKVCGNTARAATIPTPRPRSGWPPSHLDWLKATYKAERNFEASDRDLALMWRSGFTGYQKRGFDPAQMSAASKDRANRILNLLKQ
jgi:hypothetical protein